MIDQEELERRAKAAMQQSFPDDEDRVKWEMVFQIEETVFNKDPRLARRFWASTDPDTADTVSPLTYLAEWLRGNHPYQSLARKAHAWLASTARAKEEAKLKYEEDRRWQVVFDINKELGHPKRFMLFWCRVHGGGNNLVQWMSGNMDLKTLMDRVTAWSRAHP